MKKQKYVEQYKTCAFFSRVVSYSVIGSDEKLIFKIFDKINDLEVQYPLFFENGLKINRLSEWLMDYSSIPSISWIFRLPFLTSFWSSNPRKYYQKWCKALDGYFTTEEIQKIINEDIAAGSDRQFWADTIWTLMEMQKNYIPVVFELKYIFQDILKYIFNENHEKKQSRKETASEWYNKLLSDIEKSLDEEEKEEKEKNNTTD